MKKFLYVAAVAACLALCGCQQKPETAEPPVIVLGFEGELLLDPDGGEGSFSYAVESPVEGGVLEVSAPDDEWVYDFEVVEEENKVKFDVLPNDTGASRSAVIHLVYVYGDKKVEKDFTAVQEPAASAAVPAIVLGFEGELSLEPDGGEGNFSYTIESPVEGGVLEVSAPECPWVHDFVVSEADGSVSFELYANGTGAARSGEIHLAYVYRENKVENSFTAVQQAGSTIWEGTPDIIVRDMTVQAEGGEGLSVLYYINYSRDGEVTMTYEDKDWVHDVALTEFAHEIGENDNGEVLFSLDPNTGEKREFKITLTYTYEGGKDVQDFTVIQVAGSAEEQVHREMKYAMGAYNGTDKTYVDAIHEYHVYMSNQPFEAPDEYAATSASYDVYLYAAAPEDPVTMLPPAGTYPLSGAIVPDVFSLEFRDIFGDWHLDFSDGTLTLAYDDSGNMILEIIATDDETGDIHRVTFTGEVIFTDIRE